MNASGASAPLIAVNALAAAIWVGGMLAIFLVARPDRRLSTKAAIPIRIAIFHTPAVNT